jgi:hypothetical protein
MTMNDKKKLIAIVEAYLGRSSFELHAIPDPYVAGVYALRVKFDDVNVEFLLTDINDPESLEEVEFMSWPPTSFDMSGR